ILAVLESGSQQVALSSLARSVQEIAQLEQLPSPTFARRGERQAFVDVIRFLVSNGVLQFIDGDEEGYLGGTNDALYDVEQRIAANLVSTGWLPGAAPDDPRGDTGVYAENQEGANLRLRHRLMRLLCEGPVLYYEDLSPEEYEYVRPTRPTFRRELQNLFSLRLEARADGLLALDEGEGLTDLVFPAQSSVAHAALLLAFALAMAAGEAKGDERNSFFSNEDAFSMLSSLVDNYGRYWRSEYRDDLHKVREFLEEILCLLEAFAFIRRTEGGFVVRPLINRYLAEPNKRVEENPVR
ncbi:MAG: TIGR02678 family protein, partial [Candidatus Dormibacteraceae bacterium]